MQFVVFDEVMHAMLLSGAAAGSLSEILNIVHIVLCPGQKLQHVLKVSDFPRQEILFLRVISGSELVLQLLHMLLTIVTGFILICFIYPSSVSARKNKGYFPQNQRGPHHAALKTSLLVQDTGTR
ncbi:hypothetical protein [Geobacter anodireducens]|jgi:hypothetical protein|uniref:Uncharacterized protein n=1 Tax=Geobacter anodireducens TaxID=1340425 RepID=A0ABR9NZM2_9BACT|nr:hypothetical protein [Geobacter anodireducens]MBE2889733.1 hypothetical protein [Geobacter anodireducens]